MPKNSACLLVCLAIFLFGCGESASRCGSGTVLSGDECVVAPGDGGADAGDTGGGTDSGADAELPTNARLLLPVRQVITPGLVSCALPVILYDDGREERVLPSDVISVSVEDGSVAVGAEPGDCLDPGRAGVIGLSAGVTEATVTLVRGGLRARGTMLIASIASDYEVRLGGALPVRVGGSYPFNWLLDDFTARATTTLPELAGCDCRPVKRFVTARGADPSIVRVVGVPGHLEIQGVAIGATELIVDYDPPSVPSMTLRLAIRAGDRALPIESVRLRVTDDAGSLTSRRDPAVGDCVRLAFSAIYGGGFDAPSTGVVWSSGPGFTHDAAQPGRFCAAVAGAEIILGCLEGVCGFEDFVVPGSPSADALSVEILDMNLTPGGADIATVHECPRVRITAMLSDGTMTDVTTEVDIRWSIDWDGSVDDYWRTRAPDGGTVETPEGYPCLDARPPSGRYQPQMLGFTVRYRGATETFELTLVPPTA